MSFYSWVTRTKPIIVCLVIFLLIPPIAKGETKLKLANMLPPSHPISVALERWAKDVGQRTSGKLSVVVYHGGSLAPPFQTYDSVVKGICDVGMGVLGYTIGKFPLSEIVDMPIGYKNASQETGLANAFYNKFRPRELNQVKVLFFHASGPGILFTRHPVTKMEDLRGMKIRSFGANAGLVRLLGGVPVAMPMGDVYDALSKGVVDGLLVQMEAMKGWKIGEVIKYATGNYGTAYSSTFFMIMNSEKWQSLPPDTQQAIDELSLEYAAKLGKIWDTLDKEGRDFMESKGVKLINLSKEEDARWAEKVRPLLNDYVTGAKAKGLPGDVALKFCLDYLKSSTIPLDNPEEVIVVANKERPANQSTDRQSEQKSAPKSETLTGRSRPLFESNDTSPPSIQLDEQKSRNGPEERKESLPSSETKATAKPKTHQFTGKVTAIDMAIKTLTAEGNKDQKTFDIANAKMKTEPKAGDAVLVQYTEQGGKKMASSVIIVRKATAYDTDNLSATKSVTIYREAKTGSVYAAVIGINKYKDPAIPGLRYARNDAQAFAQYLRNNMGLDNDNLFELYDEQATHQNVRSLLGTRLRQKASKPEDTVFVFFAGHGAPEQDTLVKDDDKIRKYILTHDANKDDLYSTSIAMDEIADIFARIGAERVIFIVDSCYSGAGGGRTILAQRSRAVLSEDFLNRLSQGKGRIILTSSRPNELSQESDDLKHGYFTYYLLDGLKGKADINKDGIVDLDEVSLYLNNTVPQMTKGGQTPMKKGEAEGQVIVGRVR